MLFIGTPGFVLRRMFVFVFAINMQKQRSVLQVPISGPTATETPEAETGDGNAAVLNCAGHDFEIDKGKWIVNVPGKVLFEA